MVKAVQNMKGVAGTSGACTGYNKLSQGRGAIGSASGSGPESCRFDPYRPCYRDVAQQVERRALDSKAAGSTPAVPVSMESCMRYNTYAVCLLPGG
jgi:hypothetical protein